MTNRTEAGEQAPGLHWRWGVPGWTLTNQESLQEVCGCTWARPAHPLPRRSCSHSERPLHSDSPACPVHVHHATFRYLGFQGSSASRKNMCSPHWCDTPDCLKLVNVPSGLFSGPSVVMFIQASSNPGHEKIEFLSLGG